MRSAMMRDYADGKTVQWLAFSSVIAAMSATLCGASGSLTATSLW
jgi:hypothetical protein